MIFLFLLYQGVLNFFLCVYLTISVYLTHYNEIKQNLSPEHKLLVLKRYDHRIYLSPKSEIPKHSASLQNTYFHLNVDCARKKNPQFEFRDI
jgi:hypothetical protein